MDSNPSLKPNPISLEGNPASSDQPIIINGNQDFEIQGWSGSGTPEDPYKLANINHDQNSSSEVGEPVAAIDIRNTDAFFELDNISLNTIIYPIGYGLVIGILLENVTNGIIRRVNILQKDIGVSIEKSSHIMIDNITNIPTESAFQINGSNYCTIANSFLSSLDVLNSESIIIHKNTIYGRGIHVDSSRDLIISECFFIGYIGAYYGSTALYVYSCTNISLVDSTLKGQYLAISISYTESFLIERCQILESEIGFAFSGNKNGKIMNTAISEVRNAFIPKGVLDPLSASYELVNVTIEDKPIGYFGNIHDMTINATDFSFLLLQSIRNVEISNEHGLSIELGISVTRSENVSLRNVFTEYLYLSDSKQITVANSTIYGSFSSSNCNKTTITNTIIYDTFSSSNCNETSIANIFTEHLYLSDSKQITVANSTIYGSFSTSNCNETSIENVKVKSFDVGASNDFKIEKCQMEEFRVGFSNNISIIESLFLPSSLPSTSGLGIFFSKQIEVADSNFLGNGITIEGSQLMEYIHQFSNISVNGKPLAFLVGMERSILTADNYGQVILVSCSDIIIEKGSISSVGRPFQIAFSHNISIANIFLSYFTEYGLTVDYSNDVTLHKITMHHGRSGIRIRYSDSVSINNSSLEVNDLGIDIIASDFVSIHNSDFVSIYGLGLNIWGSSDIHIARNSFLAARGLFVSDSGFIMISENQITADTEGITLYWYIEAEITGNRISAGWAGIFVYQVNYRNPVDIVGNTFSQCYMGIHISRSIRTNVIGNHILSSRFTGIYVSESQDNTIAFNEIAFSDDAGMVIESSNGNSIYGNLFHDNQNAHVRGESGNTWDNSDGIGNLWDDYGGEGNYSIGVDSNSYDLHPLHISGTDYTFPLISNQGDLVIYTNQSFAQVTWVVWIDEPVEYTISYDGAEISYGTLNVSGIISTRLDHLLLGEHTLTLAVFAASGAFQSSQVNILVRLKISSEMATLASISIVTVAIGLTELYRRHKRARIGEWEKALEDMPDFH
ncbi:MAG: NosD domain-containing protein [Candidatus Thorarchaeota archaeon]